MKVAILGATGSIGRMALEVTEHLGYEVVALTTYRNVELLNNQIAKFKPKYACVVDETLKNKLRPTKNVELLTGVDGLCEISQLPEVDIVLNAVVGAVGVKPTILALESGKRVALANKECLVAFGKLIMQKVKTGTGELLPVDSEHSAILQAISSAPSSRIKKIILTASGGPFYKTGLTDDITVEQALSHPVWQMGKKITIDSATLMNKGLEMIEASVLFDVPADKIEIVIHPQAIIHSMVEFIDSSIIAQLATPDMRLPIQYAFTYPERKVSLVKSIDLISLHKLEFYRPDMKKFTALRLAYEACRKGGTFPAVLNASNEVAVNAFLLHKITLPAIPKIVEKVLNKHEGKPGVTFDEILAADKWARNETQKIIDNYDF